MAKDGDQPTLDPEVAAINAVVTAIRDLDAATQQNVIDYVVRRFKLRPVLNDDPREPREEPRDRLPPPPNAGTASETERREEATGGGNGNGDDALEGVSPVARKWMSRNDLTADGLSKLFSLGIDEIDLVAKTVPGKNKKERMRSVILLKGVAAYLGGGVARVPHDQVKETCVHYKAFDTDNFASYLKDFSAEVGGTKESGYTLTPRGLAAATDLVKEMLAPATK